MRGAAGRGDVELLRRRRHRGDRRAERGAELHGGQADAAAGAEHDELLARLQPGHRAQHVVGGAVGDAERRGGLRRRPRRGCGVSDVGAPTTASSANAPTSAVPMTRSPTATSVDVVGDLVDDAGELAAGDERRRHLELVLAGDEQHVGEVDRRGARRRTRTWPGAERRRRRRRRPATTSGGP